MNKKIAILGASGHGKVVAEIAELNGWESIDFFDDRWPMLFNIEHWPVVGDSQELLSSYSSYSGVIVAIGDNKVRYKKQQQLSDTGANIITLIHPSAVISAYSKIGVGAVVMANAVIGSFVQVGKAAIINTSATIDHDCILGDGSHISPGAHLAGAVEVGDYCWVGIGSSVRQQIRLGSNAIIGAGSAVISDIASGVTVAGVPAKPLNI